MINTIKKPVFAIILLANSIWACSGSNRNNVMTDFERLTGLNNGYSIEIKKFEANQSIVYANILDDQKDSLLARFRFMSYDSFFLKFNLTKSHVKFELYDFNTEDKHRYLYCYRDDYDNYGYFVICLEKEGNKLIFCENFPETSPGL